MGQIQNAFLNAMGSFAQAAQLYKLSEPYIKQQEAKAAQAAAQATAQEKEKEMKEKEKEMRKNITGDPITEEYKKAFKNYKESFKETPEMTELFQKKYGDKDESTDWGHEKRTLTNALQDLYKAIRDEKDPDIQAGFAMRVLLDKYHESPTSQKKSQKQTKTAEGLQQSINAVQEATDVNDRKQMMKYISGGMM